MEIVGGSYVIGLRNVNHDITKDGFYSNYLNDDYTEIVVDYIDPSPIGETGYRWIVGFEALNYTVPLTISKYSSLLYFLIHTNVVFIYIYMCFISECPQSRHLSSAI